MQITSPAIAHNPFPRRVLGVSFDDLFLSCPFFIVPLVAELDCI